MKDKALQSARQPLSQLAESSSLCMILRSLMHCSTLAGSKFEGTWENDRINGEGISYYPNGNRYEGEWQNGRINGRGEVENDTEFCELSAR